MQLLLFKRRGNGLFQAVCRLPGQIRFCARFPTGTHRCLLYTSKVVSATEVISDGAEGIILESVLEGYAEYYSADLSEKVVWGMTENALKSKYNGGTLPIGYQIDSEDVYKRQELAIQGLIML